MSVGHTPAVISLPCYDGFNQIAVWPASQSVSKSSLTVKINLFKLFGCELIIAIFQLASYYGLISTESIVSPLPSGEWMTVYFYPGFRYVAFPARSSEDVRMHLY